MVARFQGGFTVLMAVHGGDDCELFQMALESVFANTLQPDRTILLVDGVVPPALEREISVLEKNSDLIVCRLPKNLGLAKALNYGLELVDTEWIMRADADDFNVSERFSKMAMALKEANGKLDLFGSAIQEVDLDGIEVAIRRTPEEHELIRQFAKKRNPFNHMTIAMRTALARNAGGYPDVYLKEDYALWASLLHQGAVCANLPDILVHATAGRDMYRRRGGWKYAFAEIKLQRHLVRCRLKNSVAAFGDGAMRSVVFLLPSGLRAIIYENFLRR